MTRIYLNMNLMKKFNFPCDLDGENFIQEVLRKEPKANLEQFTHKAPKGRERSQTYQWDNADKRKKSRRSVYNEDEYKELR